MALLARTFRQSLLETRSSLPPTFLLPFRAHITTVSHSLESGTIADPLIQPGRHFSKNFKAKAQAPLEISIAAPETASLTVKPSPNARKDEVVRDLTPSVRQMLPLLKSQSPYYLTIHIHGRPYLLTSGDTLRLPFLMPEVQPGDILRLDRATHIGSRDYTLKAPDPISGTRDAPKKVFYLDPRLFLCRATVVGVESEPLRIKEKTKRRQRHIRKVRSKHKYTVLKIGEIEVKSLEEYETRTEEP